MKKLLCIVALAVALAACDRPPAPKKNRFDAGAIVEFVISKQKGQVISFNCFYESGCKYKIRVVEGGTVDYRKTEVVGDVNEFELQESSL